MVAGLLAMGLVGCAFALIATRGVLEQERNDCRAYARSAEPEPVSPQPAEVPKWVAEWKRQEAQRVLPPQSVRPLGRNERCISGQRFQQIGNGDGWQNLPNEPCAP